MDGVFCGATLIGLKYATSALHCFQDKENRENIDEMIVYAGRYQNYENEETQQINSISRVFATFMKEPIAVFGKKNKPKIEKMIKEQIRSILDIRSGASDFVLIELQEPFTPTKVALKRYLNV